MLLPPASGRGQGSLLTLKAAEGILHGQVLDQSPQRRTGRYAKRLLQGVAIDRWSGVKEVILWIAPAIEPGLLLFWWELNKQSGEVGAQVDVQLQSLFIWQLGIGLAVIPLLPCAQALAA